MASRRVQTVVQHVQVFKCVWFLTSINTTSGAMPCFNKISRGSELFAMHSIYFDTTYSLIQTSACPQKTAAGGASPPARQWRSLCCEHESPGQCRKCVCLACCPEAGCSVSYQWVCEQILLDANQQLSARYGICIPATLAGGLKSGINATIGSTVTLLEMLVEGTEKRRVLYACDLQQTTPTESELSKDKTCQP